MIHEPCELPSYLGYHQIEYQRSGLNEVKAYSVLNDKIVEGTGKLLVIELQPKNSSDKVLAMHFKSDDPTIYDQFYSLWWTSSKEEIIKVHKNILFNKMIFLKAELKKTIDDLDLNSKYIVINDYDLIEFDNLSDALNYTNGKELNIYNTDGSVYGREN
jgi:hypothetical protein